MWCWDAERVLALREDLATRPLLPSTTESCSCDELWSYWRTALLRTAHLYCTSFNTHHDHQSSSHRPPPRRPWMTPELVSHIKHKHKLFRNYMKSRSNDDWSQFVAQRNLTTTLVRKAKSEFVHEAVGGVDPVSSSCSLTKVYRMMTCLKSQPKVSMPDLEHNSQVLTSPVDKATALNNFFITESRKSVGDPDEPIPPIPLPKVNHTLLEGITTSPEGVESLLKSLDHTKSAGDDGIPTRLLKLVAFEIAPSLAQLFNVSFRNASLPQSWREATVIPLHKKGSRTSPTNYRPISLLSVVAKVQERIVNDRLYQHIEPFLPSDQSGFRRNDGTELQLLRVIHNISGSRDSGHCVAACFFDLSKAFDRVWHQGLLAKLEHLGVCGTALAWLRSYLTDRRQRVRVQGQTSPWLSIPAGVPQGSVLGPLLFLVYTTDLPLSCVNSFTKCSQFADDTALIASHPDRHQAESSLQEAISSTGSWLTAWHLLVNTSKTVVMSFRRGHQLDLRLNNIQLKQVDSHRHLGLIIQSDLRWNDHVAAKTAKARQLLHTLLRLRGTLSAAALKVIYEVYVRPVVEYGSLALSNLSVNLQDKLERRQRRACRICLRIPLFRPTHHTSLLHNMGLPTLASRRVYRQVIFAHALVNNNVPPRTSGSAVSSSLPLSLPSAYDTPGSAGCQLPEPHIFVTPLLT